MRFPPAVVLATAVLMLPMTVLSQRWEPLPTCRTCVSRSRILSPAMGIDIGPSYLTAAVRFHDGTVHNLVKIDGSAQYQDLMRSLASHQLETDDGDVPNRASQQEGQHRLELRSETSWSKSVQVIATALAALKAAAEPLMEGQPLPSALPTFPYFPGLSFDLVQEAMRQANIAVLGDQRVAPVGAAAAANGLGMCHNFTDIDACENEEASMPTTRLLAIEYTKTALSITLSPFQASRKGYDWINDRAWDLGASARPRVTDPEQDIEKHWQRVREEIQKIPARASPDRPINRVLVMGESVLDPKFLRVMEEALHDVLDDGISIQTDDHLAVDPTFAAARGAAEFGKRMMESPDGCAETRICKWWRKWIG